MSEKKRVRFPNGYEGDLNIAIASVLKKRGAVVFVDEVKAEKPAESAPLFDQAPAVERKPRVTRKTEDAAE